MADEDLDRQERSPDDRYGGKYNDQYGGQYGSDYPRKASETSGPNQDLDNPSSPAAIAAKEKAAGGDTNDGNHSNLAGRGYTGIGSSGSGRTKNFFGNKKRLLLLAGIPSFLMLAVVLLLVFLFPALKIPQLAYHIEEYRLVRLTRTFYKNASLLAADRAAIDAPGSDTGALLKDSKTGVMMASLRPRAVVDNMKATGVLDFEEAPGPFGTTKITAVILRTGNEERIIKAPQYKFGAPLSNYKERLRFSSQLTQGVHDVLRGNNYLVRSRSAKLLLSGWGINYSWYINKGAQFLGLSQDKADQLMLQETTSKILTPDTEKSIITPVNDAAKQGNQAIIKCEADAVCAKKLITTGELPAEVTSSIESTVKALTGKTTLSALLTWFSPIYAVAMPICIIFDGSVQFSKGFVNSQNIAATKTFLAVASADSQQRTKDVTAQAVGAFNRRIGDIANSIPEKLARGEQINTSNEISPQAAKSGEFTIFDALFGSFASIADRLANAICPAITSTGLNIGLILAGIIFGIVSGGTSAGAEEGIVATVTQFVKSIFTKIAEKFTTVEGRAALKNTARSYASSSVRSVGETAGLTYLARMIVLAEMGAFFNGTGNDVLANQADAGGVAYAQEMQRQQQFGRPLTNKEVKTAQAADNNYIAQQKASQNSFERYFALSNPDSVASNLAVKASALKMSSISNFFLDIPRIFSIIFSPLTHSIHPLATAASSIDSTDYGIIQWGWSTDEENLIDNDPTFDPLENAKIVDDPSNASAVQVIQSTYGKCFTGDIGTLLTDGSVVRDSDGVLQDSGLCSPTNLGPHNPTYGDLVFRWRLDNNYRNTLQELIDVQNVQGAG